RVKGPVIASPSLLNQEPSPELVTIPSTYALLTASVGCVGVGTLGLTVNCLIPEMVSVPATWTTLPSLARPATTASTYCRVAICEAAVPVPGAVRTIASVAGELLGMLQYSVLTVLSPS